MRCDAMCRRVCVRCRRGEGGERTILLVQMRTVVCDVERIVWGDVKIRASSRGGEILCISANADYEKTAADPRPLPPLPSPDTLADRHHVQGGLVGLGAATARHGSSDVQVGRHR